ncbi:MAG TPA: metalloregulator ArsR/SmtB family transcription factor [Verrucomicrobiae bacterium]|nr:metalloregulator ArsR/SmtB family transcription factor [Verrucomicrobiae bacterium]
MNNSRGAAALQEGIETLKVLAEPVRLRILRLLLSAGKEICVCELADSLLVPQYAVSRHVKELEREGLVRSRREGKWVYYSAEKPGGGFHKKLLQAVLALPENSAREDQKNFAKRLKLRAGGKCILGIQNKNLLPKGA